MEFVITVDPKQHTAYFKKELIQAFGCHLRLQPNTKAGIIYPEGLKASEIVKSVEILLADLRLRAEDEQRSISGESGQSRS